MTLLLTFSQSFFKQNISVQLKKIAIFSDFCYFEIKPEMRNVFAKMRECGKYAKLRDFPHDCGTVDTYAVNWKAFLRSNTNTEELFHYLSECVQACETGRKVIISTKEETIVTNQNYMNEVKYLLPSTHEKADNCIVLIHSSSHYEFVTM